MICRNSQMPTRPPTLSELLIRIRNAVVILATVVGLAAAQVQAQEKFQIIVSSDPQFPWTEEDLPEPEKIEKSKELISSQYQSMTNLQIDMQSTAPVLAMIANGDLTAFGHDWQLDEYRSLLAENLQLPAFLGLGNHDYSNNVDDCFENNCASRMVDYMWDLVRKMDPVDYDFKETTYYEFPSLRAKFEGSLAYSFNIGNVHFVQLHNYPTYERSWDGWNFGKARRDHYEIRSSMYWLENDVIAARNNGDVIILNMHDYGDKFSNNAEFTRIVNTYGVTAVYSGHIHSSIGYVGKIGNSDHFRSGSSTYQDYLLVEYDLGAGQMIVKKISNDLKGNYTIDSTVGSYPVIANVPNPPFTPIGPETTITFFNEGGFEARFYLEYDERNGTRIKEETGKMLLGNKKIYVLPPGSKNVHVKGEENTGLVWEGWRKVFDKNYIIPPNNCFKLYGTTLNPKWNNNCS